MTLHPVVGYWDPLNLSKQEFWGQSTEATLGFLRQAEIKHVCFVMAGFVSYIMREKGIHWPWAPLGSMDYSALQGLSAPELWDTMGFAAQTQVFLAVSFLEVCSESSLLPEQGGHELYMRGGKFGYFPAPHPAPFNFYDPLKLSASKSDEWNSERLVTEVSNCRLWNPVTLTVSHRARRSAICLCAAGGEKGGQWKRALSLLSKEMPKPTEGSSRRRQFIHALVVAAVGTPALPAPAMDSDLALELQRAEPGEPAARVVASVLRVKADLAKGELPIFALLTEQDDIAGLLADEDAFRALVVSGKSEAARVARQINRAAMGIPEAPKPALLSLGSLSIEYFETLSTKAADPTAVMAAAQEYLDAARAANALAELAQRNSDSSQVTEFLNGMCEATRRADANLAKVVALLPPQPHTRSAAQVIERRKKEEEQYGSSKRIW